MVLLIRVTLVIFLLLGVLVFYSIYKFVKDRNKVISEMVENFETISTEFDEESFKTSSSEKSTNEIQEEYSRYMLEMGKFDYPNNQEFVTEMAQKANVLKLILEERNEIIPGNIN